MDTRGLIIGLTRLDSFTADGLDYACSIPSDMTRTIVDQAGAVLLRYRIDDLDDHRSSRQLPVHFSRDNVPGSYQKLVAALYDIT
jgi:hypothetical protein